VKDLRLAWVWAMNDGAANQNMPLVHNGTIYVVNPGNVIQALDGRTGDLIWENEVGPLTQIGMGSMRNVAIYEDKLIVATTDARLVALDARNGKLAWTTVIADRNLGYSNTSGPIVARGKVIQGLQGCSRFGLIVASSAPTMRRPASLRGSSTPSRTSASPAATPGASCRTTSERAARPGSPAATIRI
jgi:outer membrane protein assembly factor BamB